jgi:hypothetical protein
VSSPSPEQVEYAGVLLRRAEGNLQVCRKLADDTDIDDSIIGFHAQQAAEKALKVALVLADAELPFRTISGSSCDGFARQVSSLRASSRTLSGSRPGQPRSATTTQYR